MTTKTTLIAALAAGFAAISVPASAGTVSVEKLGNSAFADENNQNKWFVGTSYTVGDTSRHNIGAGLFRLQTEANDEISRILAICLQPLETLTLPLDYEMGSNFAAAINTNLNILASNAWSLVNGKISAGAFQMAAWEITTETAQSYDIDDGFFAITSNANKSNQSEALAQSWLDNISSGEWENGPNTFSIFNAEGTQDLLSNVEVAPVPLPASGLLLIGGLLGAGALARRKQRS